MTIGYIRVSSAMQKESSDTQRYGILKLADERKLVINEWVTETVSGSKRAKERKLGALLEKLKKGDTIIVSEISRLGRSLLDVMTTLSVLTDRGVFLYTCKERFELADNINSRVLSFAFSLAAEIERKMISQRTQEALARLKAEGKKLGRPIGSKSKSMLDGKENVLSDYMAKKISMASIAKLLDCHPGTLAAFIKTRKLVKPE